MKKRNILSALGAITVLTVLTGFLVTCGEAYKPLPKGVKLNNETLTLVEGAAFRLKIIVSPSSVDKVSVTWASDDEGIATVVANQVKGKPDEGLVNAEAEGITAITATVTAGKEIITAICVVRVCKYIHTVTFDKNEGDTEAIPNTKQVLSPDTTVGTLPTPPTFRGKAFVEWNTEADGTGTTFGASTPVTGGDDNITVYAQWVDAFTVTFDKNGGSTEADPKTKKVLKPDPAINVFIDALPTSPAPPPTKGFKEWNTDPEGNGDTFDTSTPVTGDITVYAQWE